MDLKRQPHDVEPDKIYASELDMLADQVNGWIARMGESNVSRLYEDQGPWRGFAQEGGDEA
jgi:hypothetical protein